MIETITIIMSVVALAVSIITAWLALFKKGGPGIGGTNSITLPLFEAVLETGRVPTQAPYRFLRLTARCTCGRFGF